MRLVVLGHLSSFGEKRCCPATVSKQSSTWTSCALSRLVTGGSQITETCGWEFLCAISLDNLGHPPPRPLSIFSTRRHMHVEGSGTVALCPTSLADCLWFSVLQIGLARRTAVVSSRSRSNGPVIARRHEMIPRGRVGFYRTRLEAPRNPLSARAVISLGSTCNGSPQPAAWNPAQNEQPSKKRWEVDINGPR